MSVDTKNYMHCHILSKASATVSCTSCRRVTFVEYVSTKKLEILREQGNDHTTSLTLSNARIAAVSACLHMSSLTALLLLVFPAAAKSTMAMIAAATDGYLCPA
jgi:hypothetical protein